MDFADGRKTFCKVTPESFSLPVQLQLFTPAVTGIWNRGINEWTKSSDSTRWRFWIQRRRVSSQRRAETQIVPDTFQHEGGTIRGWSVPTDRRYFPVCCLSDNYLSDRAWCTNTEKAIVVNVVVAAQTSVPHCSCDWMMCLYKSRENLNLIWKMKVFCLTAYLNSTWRYPQRPSSVDRYN